MSRPGMGPSFSLDLGFSRAILDDWKGFSCQDQPLGVFIGINRDTPRMHHDRAKLIFFLDPLLGDHPFVFPIVCTYIISFPCMYLQ